METILSIKPLLAVLVSLAAVPVLLSSRTPNVREAWTFVAATAKFAIVASLVPAVLNGAEFVYTLARVVPGAPIQLRVDALGMLFALLTMLYTGALLSGSKGYPFWRTAVLPVLFMISGLVTGLFAVFLGMAIIDSNMIVAVQMKKMAAIGAGLIVAELLFIMFFLHSASKIRDTQEAAKIMMKKSSFIFGDLILGLFVPLILLLAIFFGNMSAGGMMGAAVIAAILGLIGGFLLRYAILSAGMQTSLDMSGFRFRPIARLDFERAPIGKLPPQ